MRRAAAAAALLAAGAILGVAAVEIGLRLSGVGSEFVTRDAVIGYRLTPKFTRVLTQFEKAGWSIEARTDDLGLRRDGNATVEKPTGVRRVLILGDSQTEGIVENAETYAAVLEHLLSTAALGGVEVLNAGVSGYSPLLEYLWLREWGARLEPDVVVVALYDGNDVGELTAREASFGGFGPWVRIASMARDRDGWTIQRPGVPSVLAAADHWLQAHLRAYALLRKRVRLRHSGPPEATAAAAAECFGCLQALWQPWLAQEKPEQYADAWLELRDLLPRFARLAAEMRARLLIVVLPTKLEVDADVARDKVAAARTTLGLRQDPTAFAADVRARLLAESVAAGIEVEDLAPALQRAADDDGRPLYWSQDWHLNPAGNRVVAEALAPVVADLLRGKGATAP